jgi:hypothetical protein
MVKKRGLRKDKKRAQENLRKRKPQTKILI